MKRQFLLVFILFSTMILMSSCAYMQSNQNIAEIGCHYNGKLINPPNCSTWNIYKSCGKWYVAGYQVKLKKSYPLFRDTVLFTENNEPVYERIAMETGQDILYHPISEGTAQVLIRKDGYVNLGDLAEELKNTPGEWLANLEKARSYPVQAQVDYPKEKDENKCIITGERTPHKTPILNRVLQGMDLLLVDVPGTLIYNVAIPFMAPIKFFYEFNSDY